MQGRVWKTILFIALAVLLMACGFGNLTPVQQPSPTVTALEAVIPSLPTPTIIQPTIQPSATVQPLPEPAQTATVPPVPQTITLVSREIQEDINQPPVKLSITYPLLMEPAGDKGFNQAVKEMVNAQVQDIKQKAADEEKWRAQTVPQFFSELLISYKVALAQDGLVGVRLEIAPFIAGAAHPGFFYLTYNYDLTQTREIKLADLFKPGSNYLSALSTYCLADLEKQKVEALFKEGLDPKEENFQKWNLTTDGLLILLDPYQVTPWAAGPQKVLIPYAKLKDILVPLGPVEVLTHGM